MDPISRDGDRYDVSIAGESVDLVDYEVLRDGRNPNPAWVLDSGMVWARWAGDTDPVNESASKSIFQVGKL